MLFAERQADLDDLLSSCRSPSAKRAFAEAVVCFRAGAYRACIVQTWTAVLFDYLEKLRELELSGNGDARTILTTFENARQTNQVKDAQKAEAAVLEDARDRFELLNHIEFQDLTRLKDDRNRCAHPSMMGLDEPYQPTAELARTHMRHAVQHLLSRLPVQGAEALASIETMIASEFFPTDKPKAVAALKSKIERARLSLVRTLVVKLTKTVLKKPDPPRSVRREAIALLALSDLRHEDMQGLLRDKLDALVALVPDDSLGLVVAYCRGIDSAWNQLSVAHQHKLESYVERCNDHDPLRDALRFAPLRDRALVRLRGVSADTLLEVSKSRDATAANDALDEVLRRFQIENSGSAYMVFKVLRPLVADEDYHPKWSAEHRRKLVSALATNPSLIAYMGYESLVFNA